jgi:hypothetical protein
LKWVWLTDAATELGISSNALADRLAAGEFEVLSSEYGDGLPKRIPPEHFAIPLREYDTLGADDLVALIQLGYLPSGSKLPALGIRTEWIDPDYDERAGPALVPRPRTCLDVEGCAIYEQGEPRWTHIQINLPSESRRKKNVRLDTYATYQRDTKKNTGHWSSNAQDAEWATANNYNRDSLRDVRKLFKATLSAAERQEFEKPGRRN